jgi:NADH:ubiquinone oxidoreductase subunit 6 (subunit J)
MLAVNTIGTILSIRVFISLFLFCISTAIILVTLSAEYFGLIYLLVYMGAIIMLFLFIIMLLDIYEFDEGFEFKETQIILILLSLKVGLLFEKVLFFGNSVIDVTLSEPHFSIFEFFICFYNINYVLLIFISIVLFFVMIGVVDSLINNYQDILSISKSNLKLFVYSGFVFLEKRNEDEDYDIVDSIFLMPFKFLFTGRWGWDIYVTPHLNTDPPPPAPPLYHSQMDYFDKYIRWDVMQRNYVRTNLFKYVLEGDALIGYFVISFVVIMFFL